MGSFDSAARRIWHAILAAVLLHVVVLGIPEPASGLPVIEKTCPSLSPIFPRGISVFDVDDKYWLHDSSFNRAKHVHCHSPFGDNWKCRFGAGWDYAFDGFDPFGAHLRERVAKIEFGRVLCFVLGIRELLEGCFWKDVDVVRYADDTAWQLARIANANVHDNIVALHKSTHCWCLESERWSLLQLGRLKLFDHDAGLPSRRFPLEVTEERGQRSANSNRSLHPSPVFAPVGLWLVALIACGGVLIAYSGFYLLEWGRWLDRRRLRIAGIALIVGSILFVFLLLSAASGHLKLLFDRALAISLVHVIMPFVLADGPIPCVEHPARLSFMDCPGQISVFDVHKQHDPFFVFLNIVDDIVWPRRLLPNRAADIAPGRNDHLDMIDRTVFQVLGKKQTNHVIVQFVGGVCVAGESNLGDNARRVPSVLNCPLRDSRKTWVQVNNACRSIQPWTLLKLHLFDSALGLPPLPSRHAEPKGADHYEQEIEKRLPLLKPHHVLMASFVVVGVFCAHFGSKWAGDIYAPDGSRYGLSRPLGGFAMIALSFACSWAFVYLLINHT
jgi:hypothetical protein